jgi:Ca-activated chloride channel family protein
MPYRLAVRLGFGSGLILVALFFSSTASVQLRRDSLPGPVAPTSSTSFTTSSDSDSDEQVVIDTDLISFNVTVTDKSGQHISGLPKTAFTVFDEKKPQEISFFGEDDSPISVGIVFDVSGSMTEEKVGRAREAIARFMETSHNDDEYSLIMLKDGEAFLSLDQTRDHQAVIDKLTYVTPHGATALYDACYLGLNKVLRGTRPRQALLLISDGQDNDSRYTLEELHSMVKESDVIIYSIGVAEQDNEYLTLYGEEVLTEVATMTGGKFFHPKTSEEMSEVFERIALELRHQYAIGYRPANFTTDGKWHHIKVKLAPPPGSPRLFLRYRRGYYAPAMPRRAE